MNPLTTVSRMHLLTLAGSAVLFGLVAISMAGCSSGTPIEEGEYVGGMPVDTATVEAVPGGGYQTLSGDPLIAANDGIEQESMLPYGGGDQGIRQMEDETPFYSTN
jgi:hypothetical protein